MQAKLNELVIKLLTPTTTAFDLLSIVKEIDENPDKVVQAYLREAAYKWSEEDFKDPKNFDCAAAEAALALLKGEPCTTHIGRMLFWNFGLWMTPDKVRNLAAQVKQES
jgi:hypothetical protein